MSIASRNNVLHLHFQMSSVLSYYVVFICLLFGVKGAEKKYSAKDSVNSFAYDEYQDDSMCSIF